MQFGASTASRRSQLQHTNHNKTSNTKMSGKAQTAGKNIPTTKQAILPDRLHPTEMNTTQQKDNPLQHHQPPG